MDGRNKPDIIILAAAKVGGIKYNMLNRSAFLENLMIQIILFTMPQT